MKTWTSKTKEELIVEILQYRKLIKNQRKILESLSTKVTSKNNTNIILNLKEQIKFYKAKSKVLERELGNKKDFTESIYKEIQNQLEESDCLK